MNKAELENKILEAIRNKCEQMEQYDAERQAVADKYYKQAEETTDEYWKKDYISNAEWELGFKHHGYDFKEEWKNAISKAMYNKVYHKWHCASCGTKYHRGHGGYASTELSNEEYSNINKIFSNMVEKGYFKISKSGYKAKFTK